MGLDLSIGILWIVCTEIVASCQFAGAMTIPSGTPLLSVNKLRFTPNLPLSVEFFPYFFYCFPIGTQLFKCDWLRQWKPYEVRASRTVLRDAAGADPAAHSPFLVMDADSSIRPYREEILDISVVRY